MTGIYAKISTLLCGLLLTFAGSPAAAETALKAYVFGNSLVHHLTETDETALPHWLYHLAKADGHGFAVDGQWGFLRNFQSELPPTPNWGFRDVPGAWNPDRLSFGKAGFDIVMLNPANFIQHRSPDAPYEDDPAAGQSPLSATLALVDWVGAQTPQSRIVIYEGWEDMAGYAAAYPPTPGEMAAYHANAVGNYHDWFRAYHDALTAARPDLDIRLVPVASTLSRLLTSPPLSVLPADALYSDLAPHGTPTLYLLAAMITYAEFYGEAPPAGFAPPDSIHPVLREAYQDVAGMIRVAVQGKETAVIAPQDTPAPAPQSAARADAETGLVNPSLAMGLNGLADWSVQHPFIDLMKTARQWVGHTPAQWGAWDAAALVSGGYLDENGWPLSLPPGVNRLEALILTDQPSWAHGLAGRYRLTYQGRGTVKVVGRVSEIAIRGNRIGFTYTPGEGSVAIAVFDTDPDDPVRDIAVIRSDHADLHAAGMLFNPDWIRRVRDLRALRFMDWMFTNGSPVTTWQDRPRLQDYTYARAGAPVEIMVALANEIGADPWFTMPHQADDDYVRHFATYVRDHLDPRLMVYAEYSNEVWNHIFPQAEWLREQALDRWGDAAEQDGWMQYAGMRAAEVAAIWQEAFGADAEARLVRVVAVHTGWPGLEEPLLRMPLWQAETGFTPDPAGTFDAYAVSGYFGYELGTDEQADRVRDWIAQGYDQAAAQAAAALRAGSLNELLNDLYPHHARVAAALGLDLIMYEGGTHVAGTGAQVNDAEMTAFFTRFNYSPEMAALYDTLLSGWRQAGGTLFNAFVDVASPTQWGSWGALRHLDDDNPRWDVLMAHNRGNPGWWESRAPGAFLQGVLRLGTDESDLLRGTVEEDTLLGLEGDDILIGSGGGDRLHGGAGMDNAVLPGKMSDYRFSRDGKQVLATGAQGITRLTDIELVQFAGDPGQVVDTADLP